MDIFREAQTQLFDDLQAFAASEVAYRRGAESFTPLATKGVTGAERHDGDGMIINDEIRDWLINRDQMVLNGVAVEPEEGDEIVETDPQGVTNVWKVLPLVSDRCWRWSGPHNLRFRIHVKLIYSDPPEHLSGSGHSSLPEPANVEFADTEMAEAEFS